MRLGTTNRAEYNSALDRIDSLSVVIEGAHSQAHLLAQLPADESPHAVGLPPSRSHDGLQTGTRWLSEEADHARRLARLRTTGRPLWLTFSSR